MAPVCRNTFRRVVLIAIILSAGVVGGHAEEVPEVEPLRFFYGAKIGTAVLLAGSAATDPELTTGGRLVAGSAAVLLGLPASIVMYQSYQRDSQALRRWRTVSFGVDVSLSAGLAGYGTYLITNGDDVSDQWAGLAAVSVGLIGALLSVLDLVPFRLEG